MWYDPNLRCLKLNVCSNYVECSKICTRENVLNRTKINEIRIKGYNKLKKKENI